MNASPTRWIHVDESERRRAVNNVFIARASTDEIRAVFDKVRRDIADNSEVTCVIFTGEHGAGKSTFLKRYESLYPTQRVNRSIVRPVIYVSLPSNTTALGMAKILLQALMGDGHTGGTQVDLTIRVKTQLLEQRVELILVDEFHHVVEIGGRNTLSKCADWIKEVVKTTGTSLCMCGMPSVSRIVEANAQLNSITPYRFHIGPYEYEAAADKIAFRKFLAQVDAALPFDRPCGLGDAELALPLFLISQGNLRTMMRMVRQAAFTAIGHRSPVIRRDDLAHAFEHFHSVMPLTENPFVPTAGLEKVG